MARLAPLLGLVAAAAMASPAPGPATAAPCPASVATELATTATARQLITVVAPSAGSSVGSLSTWLRSGSCWHRAGGPWPAQLGAAGLSSHHREGDGTTPEGAFGIGKVVYGNDADPGLRYRFHRLVCGDWWDEDPTSPAYNRFVHVPCGQRPAFGGDSEALWRSPVAYAYFALIDYNVTPVVPGAGSAIFLHVDFGEPTAGCVALALPTLVDVLRWLRPDASPRIVIGTVADIRRY